jgi:hypothetical protein
LHQEQESLAADNILERFGAKRQTEDKNDLPAGPRQEGQITSMDTAKQQASKQAQLQAQ